MDITEPFTVKRRRTREDRRRTARACDRCRRLKERCEGGIPCARCMHLRRTCEFKRLLPVEHERAHGPVPTESTILSSPDVNVPELLERVMYMENILKHKFEGIDLDIDSLRRMSRALDEYEQNSTSAPPDEDPIEEEVCTIDPVEDTTTHYSGEFSYWNFSMRVKRHIEDRMQAQDPVQVSNYWRAEQLHSGANSIAAAISCCPPRHIADFLIKVFFKHAETYYFVVDKDWLMEKVDALYSDPARFGNKSASVISVILTVFAIATQYAYLDSPGQRSTEFSEDALGTMFYQQAIRLLPEIIEASSLESVQACLLFAIYALPLDASGLGYVYITLTNRLGMQNGMHRKYTGSVLSTAMIETRNRVWWTAYTVERKISIFHGRPLSTHRFDVDAPLPTFEEGPHVDGRISTISYMVASIQLTRRLEELCQEMFLLRTCPKRERLAILSRLINGKADLEAWWKTLPDEMHKPLPSQHTHFRARIHLRLEYCLISMFIGRPLLLNRTSSRSAPTSPETSNSGCNPEDAGANNADNQTRYRLPLVNSCIESAKEALRLCGILRNNGPGLARASYIEYSSCRASLLVLIARSIQDQSSEFRHELREGLDMVREMAASGESARSEVALLESLERALGRLQCANNSTENSERPETQPASDYEGFKNWETMWKSGSSLLPEGDVGLPSSQWTPPSGAHWGHSFTQRMQTGPCSSTLDHNENLLDIHSPHSFDALPLDNGDLHMNPELRFLQEFLAIPGYRFDAGLAVDTELGLGGIEAPFSE